MANKETNNFKQALNELLAGKLTTDEPPKAAVVEEEKEINFAEEILQEAAPQITEVEIPQEEAQQEEAQQEEAQQEETASAPIIFAAEVTPVSSIETIVAADVVIEGNIRSNSKLIIKGEVTGDVKSTAQIVVEGKVGGSLEGCDIFLSQCEVNNCVNASNEITISESSVINGDIKAGSVISSGSVNGNIDAEVVALNGTSQTVGDIKCKRIKISEGAGLKGKLETIS